jgi:hypothetical protein
VYLHFWDPEPLTSDLTREWLLDGLDELLWICLCEWLGEGLGVIPGLSAQFDFDRSSTRPGPL